MPARVTPIAYALTQAISFVSGLCPNYGVQVKEIAGTKESLDVLREIRGVLPRRNAQCERRRRRQKLSDGGSFNLADNVRRGREIVRSVVDEPPQFRKLAAG